MIPRLMLLGLFVVWTAYESRFSPRFFMDTVKLSLAEMQSGLDNALGVYTSPVLRTAASE